VSLQKNFIEALIESVSHDELGMEIRIINPSLISSAQLNSWFTKMNNRNTPNQKKKKVKGFAQMIDR
jgi:hypothetical protein